MRQVVRLSVAAVCAAAMLVFPAASAGHHPLDDDGIHDFGDFSGGSFGSSHGNADLASPNMFHTANRPNPLVTNSDLAFWKEGAVRGPHQ